MKISGLTAITQAASGDMIPVLDVSDTSQGANGSTRKIPFQNLGIASLIVSPSGNATTDTNNILAANTSLQSSGGTIGFVNGTYYINPNLIEFYPNIRLSGLGYSTKMQLTSAGKMFKFADGDSGGHRLNQEIRNIRFDGGTYLSSQGIDCGLYGQEFTIEGCWFHNFGNRHDSTLSSYALNMGGTNKKAIITNNFFGGSANGNSMAIRLSAVGDIQIIGNNFHDYYNAIHGNGEKLHIVGNDIYNGDGIGINIGTTSGGLQTVNIVGNTISDCDQGIKIGLTNAVEGAGGTVMGNFIRNIDGNAIYFRGNHNKAIGNYFQNIARTGVGNNSHGILITDAQYVKIIGNDCFNSHTNMGYFIAPLDTVTGNLTITENDSVGHQTAIVRRPSIPNFILRNNSGFVTEASGTATITSGSTSTVITHGLSVTPTLKDITVILGENPTSDPGNIWVDTITSTQFTINCRNNPGASNLDLAWKAIVL